MLDITVKTLDGQNKSFSTPEDTTVGQFKEKIANSIGIPADTQRLIFHGRVLQDEKPLREYDVHGKVIHVVQRAPPSSLSSDSNSTPQPQHDHHHPHHHHHGPNVQSILLGSFTLPEMMEMPMERTPGGGSLNVHINFTPVTLGGVPSSAPNSTPSSRPTSGASSREGAGQSGGGGGGGGMSGNSVAEAAQRLAQIHRNLALAEQAMRRLERSQAPPEPIPPGDGPQSRQTQPVLAENETRADQPATTSDSAQPQATASAGSTPRTSTPVDATPTTEQQAESSQAQNSQGSENSQQQQARQARPCQLADTLRQVEGMHQQLSPYITRLCDLASTDPEMSEEEVLPRQRMVDHVSEALHALSHCYHNISDIIYELGPPPPRNLMAQRLPIYQPGPQHPNIVINAEPRGTSNTSQSSDTVNNNASDQSAATSSTQASQQPASAPSTTANRTTHTFSSSSSSSHSVSMSATATSGEGSDPLEEMGAPAPGEDPYVFVEVGPDSVTVNSISTHVVMSGEGGDTDDDASRGSDGGASDSSPTSVAATTSPSTPATTTSSTSASTPWSQPHGPGISMSGMPSIPGLTGDFVNSIVQSVLQAHGVRQGQPVQVNVVPMPGGPMPGMGMMGPATINITHHRAAAPPGASNGSSSATSANGNRSSATTASTTAPSTTGTATASPPSTTAAPSAPGLGPATRGPRPQPSGPGMRPNAPGAPGGPGMPIFARIPVFRQRAPAFPPRGLLPMPLMQPTDIYLPCFSHHFITQGVRDMFDQRVQDQGGNMPANLGNMMAGMMSTLFGQPLPRGPPMERQSQQPGGTPQRGANDNSTRAQTNTTATQQGSISANPFAALFSQLLGGAAPPPVMQAGLAGGEMSGNGAAGEGQGAPMSDDTFVRMLHGIRQQATQTAAGAPSSQTLASFLQSLGDNHSIVPGEGLLTDAFLCVAQHLTFSDLFSIFLGNLQQLSRLRQPLSNFVCENILQGAEATDANLRQAADRIAGEMMPDIRSSLEGVEVRQDVDIEATMTGFLNHHLMAAFTFLTDSSVTDEQFATRFYGDLRGVLGEFLVLAPLCLRNGNTAFQTVLQNRLASIMSGLSPMLRQWMSTMTLQYINTFRQTVTTREVDIQHFIVRRSATASRAPSAASTAVNRASSQSASATVQTSVTAAARAKETSSPARGEESAMEVDSPAAPAESRRTAPNSLPQSLAPYDGEERRIIRVVNGNYRPSAQSPSASAASPSDRNDNWQEVMPAEWVPVIEADVQRQKTQRPSAPLSDAYLQGMPPKRRRLMTYDQPGAMSNMADYLPDALKQAAGRAGVEPISSTENLATEAAGEVEIHSMLEAEVQRSLADRLEQDDDYSSERFPSAQQYFNTKPKPS